jgi:hypothetical protein
MLHTEPAPTVKVTGLPLAPPVADTVKESFFFEVGGAGVINVIVWFNGTAFTLSVNCGAAEYKLVPAWFATTAQVPVPLIIVYIALFDPLPLHAPEAVSITGLPLPPPAHIMVKLLP